MLQSDYVKSVDKPEGIVHSVNADFHPPSIVSIGPSLSDVRATTVQSDVILDNNVETTTMITRKTGLVFKNDQWQTEFTDEGAAVNQPESAEGMGAGGNTLSNQKMKNETVKTTMDIFPMTNHTAGEPVEDNPENLNTYEPGRLTAPRVEEKASNWLEYGDENGVREDPLPFIWPAEKHWLSGYNFSIYHPGIDIAANTGDLIFAAASGKVISVYYSNRGYGNMVLINHLNGYQSLYAHLSTILTEMGTYVIQGQPIGLAGSTGNSTGSHLHFEIHDQGRYVNPWQHLTQ